MTDQAAHALTLVEGTLARLGIDPATARLPGDAKTTAFALRRGSARVIVAVHAAEGSHAGSLRVVAPVVRVPADGAHHLSLFRRVLELNGSELQGAAFGIFGDDVVLVAERGLKDLDSSEVDAAIRSVGALADRWDDALAKDFHTVRSSDA